jgi:hypothetical protein
MNEVTLGMATKADNDFTARIYFHAGMYRYGLHVFIASNAEKYSKHFLTDHLIRFEVRMY